MNTRVVAGFVQKVVDDMHTHVIQPVSLHGTKSAGKRLSGRDADLLEWCAAPFRELSSLSERVCRAGSRQGRLLRGLSGMVLRGAPGK